MEPRPLKPTDLTDEVQTPLFKQSYAPRPSIAGVELSEAAVFRSADGLFAELVRTDRETGAVQGLQEFRPVQWNWTLLEPGAVKGWHLHLAQDDLFIVPPISTLLIGLVDLRRDAHGGPRPAPQSLVLGAGRCHRLRVPRGVAHGIANLRAEPQAMLYAVDAHFDAEPDRNDEWRLPWDHFGAEFWSMPRG
jgi:dTDP-4-dehydrorhamnose 3,5-epimerase